MNFAVWLAAVAAAALQPAILQGDPPVASANPAPAAQTAPVPIATFRLKRDTPVRIVIERTMVSDQIAPGDYFPISLADSVAVEGRGILSAGITGEGEVIDAKKSGGGGAAGGIVANARYLTCGQTRVPLGKMHLIAAGRDGTTTAIATSAVVGVFGLLVKGRNAQIAKGTLAEAKIIADVDLPATC